MHINTLPHDRYKNTIENRLDSIENDVKTIKNDLQELRNIIVEYIRKDNSVPYSPPPHVPPAPMPPYDHFPHNPPYLKPLPDCDPGFYKNPNDIPLGGYMTTDGKIAEGRTVITS